MRTSDNVTNIIKARIEAKKNLNKPKKDGTNPHFRSKYISYDSLIKAVEEAMLPQGLDMYVELVNVEESVGCRITLFHVSGEFIESEIFYLPSSQKNAQAHGSASTYVMRYSISAFWSLCSSEDDDGAAASESGPSIASKAKNYYTRIAKQFEPVSPISLEDKFDIIQRIKDAFLVKDINYGAQEKWVKEKYNVDCFEKLENNQLITLLARLNAKNGMNNLA